MMRFDLTCNLALRVEPGRGICARVLPAVTEQQRLLHEVIWVEGCDRWTTSVHPDGTRVLDLAGCQSEVRVAFAASLTLAPVWCHAAALREVPSTRIAPPFGCSRPSEHWSEERIVAALRPALRDPAAVFASLPELFEWLRQCIETNEWRRYARAPLDWIDRTTRPQDPMLEPLQFALAVFRSLGVPARIAVGFAPESAPPQRHDARAFYLELYAQGHWWLFQPDGQVPAFGCIRTAAGCELSDLPLLRGAASGRSLRMDASVDPPPAWGLPLRTSSRLLLSLDAEETASPQANVSTPSAAGGGELVTSG